MKKILPFALICLLVFACNRNRTADQTRIEPPMFDTTKAHYIFLAEGFSEDRVVVKLNDSVYYTGKPLTGNAGEAKEFDTNIPELKRVSISIMLRDNKWMDSTYTLSKNSRCIYISRDTTHFRIYESHEFPVFE